MGPLLSIFLIVMVDVLGLTIMLPLLPFYAQHYGATAFQVGLLVTSYAVCQFISGPILGKLSDQQGRKKWLIISQIGTLIGFLILANAQTLQWLFIGRMLDGITAGNLSIAQASISDFTPPEKRAKSFGIIGIAFGLGFLVGPAISGALSQFGYTYPIYASAFLSLTSIIFTVLFLPAHPTQQSQKTESAAPQERLNFNRKGGAIKQGALAVWSRLIDSYSALSRPDLKKELRLFFIFSFSFSLFFSGFSLFAERKLSFNASQVATVFAFTGFLGAILQGGLIGRLVARFGEQKLTLSGFIATTLAYTGLAFVWNWSSLLLTATINAYGNGVLRPALMSSISQKASPKEQGHIIGTTQSLNSIAQIFAPLLSGFLIQKEALSLWCLAMALTTVIGVLIARPSKRTI